MVLAYLKGLLDWRREKATIAELEKTGQGRDVALTDSEFTMWCCCSSFWFHDFGRKAWAKISRDGRKLLCGGDKTTGLWDATRLWTPIAEFDFPAEGAVFSNDSSRALVTMLNGCVGVFDTSNGDQLMLLNGGEGRNRTFDFSHDDALIITTSDDRTTRLWDAKSGDELATFPGGGTFDPTGHRLLTKSDKLCLWDCTTKDLLWEDFPNQAPTALDGFSPDGKLVLSETTDSFRLLDSVSGEVRNEWKYHGDVHAALFSPDGERLLTGSTDGTHLWNTKSGEEIATIGEGFEDFGDSAGADGVFSSDGARVITKGRNIYMFARVSCARTGKEIARLSTADHNLASSVLSTDGRRALTTDGCEVLIMHVDTAKVISRIYENRMPKRLSMARFCANDQRVLTLAGFEGELSSETLGDRRYVTVWEPE